MLPFAARRLRLVLLLGLFASSSSSPGRAVGQELTFRRLAGSLGGPGAEDGTGAEALLNAPWGLATDAAGNLYVADTYNHAIRRVSIRGELSTVAGLAGQAALVDGTGADARFWHPTGILVDPSGTLVVTDASSAAIRLVSPGGRVTTLRRRPDSPARLVRPAGIGRDAAGNLYVADDGGDQVVKVSPAGLMEPFAGLSGTSGDADGMGLEARFSGPKGIAVDPLGNVFVADAGNSKVRKISASGAVTTFAAASNPRGLAFDASGNLYVAEQTSHTVLRISPSGAAVRIAGRYGVGGSLDGPSGLARLLLPQGLAVDSAGVVYVAELPHAIRRVSPGGTISTLVGRAGYSSLWADVGSEAGYMVPLAVAPDREGNAIVIDRNAVRKVGPLGVVTTLAGSPELRGSADGVGSHARFNDPRGLTVGPSGEVYVADTSNQTIRRVAPDGVVTTLAGRPMAPGTQDGAGSAATFSHPSAIARAPSGDLLVVGYGPVRRVTPGGVVTTLPMQDIGESPGAIAVDALGKVFLAYADSQVIRRLDPDGALVTVAGSVHSPGTSDGSGAEARFFHPTALAAEAGGDLLVADYAMLRRVTPSGIVSTIAGRMELGCADGTGAVARFSRPWGLATDPAGNVYVADTGNHAIRKGAPALQDHATIDSPFAAVGKPRQLGTSPSTAASWSWRLIRRPSTSKAELSDPRVASPTFVPDVPDIYVFRLEASDFHRESITTVSLRAVDFGDVTGDGRVDVFDLVTLAAHLVGNATPGAAPFLGSIHAARLNAGEEVDVFDLVVLAGYVAGNVPEIPAS